MKYSGGWFHGPAVSRPRGWGSWHHAQSMLFIVPSRHGYSLRLKGAACWWPWTTIIINEDVQKLNYSLDHSLPQMSPFHCFACSLLSPSALSQVFLLLHVRSCFFRSLSHSSSRSFFFLTITAEQLTACPKMSELQINVVLEFLQQSSSNKTELKYYIQDI